MGRRHPLTPPRYSEISKSSIWKNLGSGPVISCAPRMYRCARQSRWSLTVSRMSTVWLRVFSGKSPRGWFLLMRRGRM